MIETKGEPVVAYIDKLYFKIMKHFIHHTTLSKHELDVMVDQAWVEVEEQC